MMDTNLYIHIHEKLKIRSIVSDAVFSLTF